MKNSGDITLIVKFQPLTQAKRCWRSNHHHLNKDWPTDITGGPPISKWRLCGHSRYGHWRPEDIEKKIKIKNKIESEWVSERRRQGYARCGMNKKKIAHSHIYEETTSNRKRGGKRRSRKTVSVRKWKFLPVWNTNCLRTTRRKY